MATHKLGFRFTGPGMGVFGDGTNRRWLGNSMPASSRNVINLVTYSSSDRWMLFSSRSSQPRYLSPVVYKGSSPSRHFSKTAVATSTTCGTDKYVRSNSGWLNSRFELSSHLSTRLTSSMGSDVFCSPPESKRYGVSLTAEGKLGWEHGGVVGGGGGVDSVSVISSYTLS